MADLRSLEAFVWIAHFGGFRAAAEGFRARSRRSRSASRCSSASFGVRLFDREPRGVALIERELAEGRLRLVRAEHEIPELEFYAAYPSKPDSHRAEAIAAMAQELSRAELPGTA